MHSALVLFLLLPTVHADYTMEITEHAKSDCTGTANWVMTIKSTGGCKVQTMTELGGVAMVKVYGMEKGSFACNASKVFETKAVCSKEDCSNCSAAVEDAPPKSSEDWDAEGKKISSGECSAEKDKETNKTSYRKMIFKSGNVPANPCRAGAASGAERGTLLGVTAVVLALLGMF